MRELKGQRIEERREIKETGKAGREKIRTVSKLKTS